MFKNILNTLAGNPYEREIKRYRAIVEQINALEPEMQRRSDDELRDLTDQLSERVQAHIAGIEDKEELKAAEREILEEVLPEAFAAVREASMRTISLRHFDVQMIGGIVLHEGKIAEMKTGEGKTLVASLPLYLNALTGKGVHLITVNDYLARRDVQWMGPIFYKLGVSCASIVHEASFLFDPTFLTKDYRYLNLRPITRQEAYRADITYGTNNECGFDYLRDNMKFSLDDYVQRELHYAIVDEVDNILIDEARTPLIISGPAEEATDKYYVADRVARRLKAGMHFEIKEKERMAHLTDEGTEQVEKLLNIDSLYTDKNMEWPHYIEQALRRSEEHTSELQSPTNLVCRLLLEK